MKTNIQKLYRSIKRPVVIKLVFPALLLLFSFKPDESTGRPKLPVVRKELTIESAFQNIRIDGDISVMLTNDPAGKIIIEGKEKELNKIRPVLKNNTLIMDVNRNKFFSKLTIYLSAITLQTIQLNGNANIYSIDFIKSDHLHIWLNGNINVRVKTLGQLSFDTPDDVELSWKSPLMKRNNGTLSFINGE